MIDRVFVDTNILVYAHDLDAGDKRDRAAEIVRELWTTRSGVVSLQVLQEFYVNVTRKIPQPLSVDVARAAVESYCAWTIALLQPIDMRRAIDVSESNRLSFWDALIIVAASKSKSVKLLTQDMNHGQIIEGVRLENPFA